MDRIEMLNIGQIVLRYNRCFKICIKIYDYKPMSVIYIHICVCMYTPSAKYYNFIIKERDMLRYAVCFRLRNIY